MTKELAERFRDAGAECSEAEGDWTVRFPSVHHAIIVFSGIALALGSELETATEIETIKAVGEDYTGFAGVTTRSDGDAVVVS